MRDFQIPSRTLRADMVKIAPELDFIFVKAGGGVFAAYRLSTFPSKLGSPLTTLTPPRTPPFTEMYLDFDMSVDPQRPGSGWNAPQFDG
ncbi:MAG: hypothetical protein ACXVH7_10855, partial [Thermoanaerobaculia bacterium]